MCLMVVYECPHTTSFSQCSSAPILQRSPMCTSRLGLTALFALGLPMVRTIAAPRGGSPHVAVVGRIVCRRRSGFLCCAGKMAVAGR